MDTAVAIAIASTTPSHGFQPRFWPPVTSVVTMFASENPAIPKIAVWASETIPPYADRKMRLAAATPSRNVWVRMKLTQ